MLFVMTNNYRRSFFTGAFRMFKSSYFIHKVTVSLVLYLIYADLSCAIQPVVVDPQSSSPAVSAGSGSTRLNLDSEVVSKDIIKDGDEVVAEQRTFFGEDANGVPIVSGTWFRYGSYTLAFCLFGTAFLVACAASAIYYVVFVVTEPSQQRSASANEEAWSVGRILRALQLAYDTYESFDPYSPACQLKTVCEIQESEHFEGSLIKRVTHFMIHTDMARKKFRNADDLSAADRIGNDPSKQCSDNYPECHFSINNLYERYLTI